MLAKALLVALAVAVAAGEADIKTPAQTPATATPAFPWVRRGPSLLPPATPSLQPRHPLRVNPLCVPSPLDARGQDGAVRSVPDMCGARIPRERRAQTRSTNLLQPAAASAPATPAAPAKPFFDPFFFGMYYPFLWMWYMPWMVRPSPCAALPASSIPCTLPRLPCVAAVDVVDDALHVDVVVSACAFLKHHPHAAMQISRRALVR